MKKTFGERLKDVMIDNYITSAELSRKSGVNEKTIYVYTHNKKVTPSALTVKKLADALDTTLPYLLYGEKGDENGSNFCDFKALKNGIKSISKKLKSDEKLELIGLILGLKNC